MTEKEEYVIDHIVIEYRNVIPVQSYKFDLHEMDIVKLYNWTEKIGKCIKLNFGQAGRRLIIFAESSKGFLELCHKDGFCGICDAKLDPTQKMPEKNTVYKKGYECCAYCGSIICEKKETSLVELFNFLTDPKIKTLNA